MQSALITTYVLSSNPAHGEVYSIQHYVIKFVSDLRQGARFLLVLRFPPPPIKLRSNLKALSYCLTLFIVYKSHFFVASSSSIFFFSYKIWRQYFFFSNKNHHEITEILLKVALNTINQTHVSFADFHTCKKCSNTTMKCHIIEI